MNWNQALFPSLKRRGGCAIKKISRSNLSSRRRGGQTGETLQALRFRRTDHPVCSALEASRLFINAAATPPFQGGENAQAARDNSLRPLLFHWAPPSKGRTKRLARISMMVP